MNYSDTGGCQTKEVTFYFAFIAWWHIRRTR